MTTRRFALGLVLAFAVLSDGAFGQAAPQQVRVPDRQANTNVHMGPSSGQPILVLVPKGTVLAVIKTQGEWFNVRLAPELRKLGTPMRWYKNEDQGFVHESTVEVVPSKPQPPRKPLI